MGSGHRSAQALARRRIGGATEIAEELDIAIVGAGPFGLSIAAHLQQHRTRTFGEDMQTWRRRMPEGMLLRSAWEETSLSARDGTGTLDDWRRAADEPRREPIPLEVFLRYAAWFANRFVRDRDPSDVSSVEPTRAGYRLITVDGSEVDTRTVVVAVGVMPFAYVPPPLRRLFGESVTLATANVADGERFAGQRVLVVGGGQAGLEAAGLAAQSGASVELVTRSRVRWFADREPHYPRGPVRRRMYRLAYPAVGYGPPLLNRLPLQPDAFAMLPERLRRGLTARVLRSGGSPWLRTLVERSVRVTEHTTVAHAEGGPGSLVVRLTDGSQREIDQVLVACGYRFDLDRLSFLAPEIRSRIDVRNGWPVLDRFFRSSDPNILFVGFAAEQRFGPLSRFVLGAEFTATRVRQGFES